MDWRDGRRRGGVALRAPTPARPPVRRHADHITALVQGVAGLGCAPHGHSTYGESSRRNQAMMVDRVPGPGAM